MFERDFETPTFAAIARTVSPLPCMVLIRSRSTMMRLRHSVLPSRFALRSPATTRSDSRACSCFASVARMATLTFARRPDANEPQTEDHTNRYGNPSTPSVAIQTFNKEFTIASQPAGRLGCPIHLDHPVIAITRAYQRARNNWDFDPQGIEHSSDAGGMDSLDTCNPSLQLAPISSASAQTCLGT